MELKAPFENSVKLMDLPVELLLNIFEHLDLKSLIRVGQTNLKNREIVHTIFRTKYKFANKTFQIFQSGLKVQNTEDALSLETEFDVILEFFQYFGDEIKNLDIYYERKMNHSIQCESLNR